MDWFDDERDRWAGWEQVFGPSALVVTAGFSVLANVAWGRMIGDVACGWRLSYSPRGPAFSIWGVIYLWTFCSVLFQFLTNMNADMWYCPAFGVNVLVSVAWLACCAWIYFFSLADSSKVKDGLGWAAWLLVVAAMCAGAAVLWESSWLSKDATRILTVGVPLSLFGGWLALAASLSVGVFLASETRPPDCTADDDVVEVRTPTTAEAWAPIALGILISSAAVGVADPVYVLPFCWGSFFMSEEARMWPSIVGGLGLLATLVRVFFLFLI